MHELWNYWYRDKYNNNTALYLTRMSSVSKKGTLHTVREIIPVSTK